MKQTFCRGRYIAALALCATWAVPAWAKKCPADSVQVGPACVDTYEASVWQIAPSNAGLAHELQVELGRVRHDRQRGRVGGGLG